MNKINYEIAYLKMANLMLNGKKNKISKERIYKN